MMQSIENEISCMKCEKNHLHISCRHFSLDFLKKRLTGKDQFHMTAIRFKSLLSSKLPTLKPSIPKARQSGGDAD